MTIFRVPAYFPERRGNKISKSKVYRVKGATDGPARIVDLCTSDDVIEQIKQALRRPCQDYAVPSELTAEYTHRLHFPAGLGPRGRRLLAVLEDALTIEVPEVDVTIALGWYKIPPDDEHPDQRYWRDTELGAIRKRAKYETSSAEGAAAFAELVTRMCNFADAHPLFAAADAVVTVPGHDRSVVSFAEDFARRVAVATMKDLVRTESRYETRPAAKDGAVDLKGQFFMPASLSDRTVIIVDDTIQSGDTMRNIAGAARHAGATRVLGLVPVRNMRGWR